MRGSAARSHGPISAGPGPIVTPSRSITTPIAGSWNANSRGRREGRGSTAPVTPLPDQPAAPPVSRSLLMSHGMWGSPYVWENSTSYFARLGYTIEAPALRHHGSGTGATPDELGRLSLLDYAGDLEAVIRQADRIPVLLG